MTSITSWTRLEPNTQNEDIKPALQARIFDPVWMLTRQWQVGEFQGEDAGSPIVTQITAECALLSRVQPGNADTAVIGNPYHPKVQPLEPFIECESVRPLSDSIEGLIQSAEAGQHFLRLLGIELEKKYRPVLVSRFAMPAIDQLSAKENSDENGLRFLRIMTGRVPNGAKLMLAYRQNELISLFDSADVGRILPLADAWSKWYSALFVEPVDPTQTAWSSARMEYAFSVAAPTDIESPSETVLCAREYFDGHPDWYDFQYRRQSSLGAIEDHRANNPNSGNPFLIEQTTIPAPVTYPGMPALRWWEFEDADVNFGAVESAPDELIRMLMVAFAVSYANDWFVVPLELPVGSLCQIKSLVVTDTFGVKSLIPSSKTTTDSGNSSLSSSWRMFELSEDRVNSPSIASTTTNTDLFFLAPTLLNVSESKPLEDVVILRDEMANLAWAVEGTVEGISGLPIDRREQYKQKMKALHQAKDQENTDLKPAFDTLNWRLQSDVPDYWIPLIPVQADANTGAINFRRGRNRNTPNGAQGRILKAFDERLDILEEEIPREGLHLTRTYQLARWIDGSTYLWVGRYKETGRGEGSSGLRFDTAVPRVKKD